MGHVRTGANTCANVFELDLISSYTSAAELPLPTPFSLIPPPRDPTAPSGSATAPASTSATPRRTCGWCSIGTGASRPLGTRTTRWTSTSVRDLDAIFQRKIVRIHACRLCDVRCPCDSTCGSLRRSVCLCVCVCVPSPRDVHRAFPLPAGEHRRRRGRPARVHHLRRVPAVREALHARARPPRGGLRAPLDQLPDGGAEPHRRNGALGAGDPRGAHGAFCAFALRVLPTVVAACLLGVMCCKRRSCRCCFQDPFSKAFERVFLGSGQRSVEATPPPPC